MDEKVCIANCDFKYKQTTTTVVLATQPFTHSSFLADAFYAILFSVDRSTEKISQSEMVLHKI